MLGTKVDIIYIILIISHFTTKPTQKYWNAISKIFQYLHKIINFQLIFKDTPKPFTGFTNVN